MPGSVIWRTSIRVTAKGIQYFDEKPTTPTIVAREIFILQEKKEEE
jgi:hypothetical protein